MARFIAIPVAQGDAFYLERDGFSTLVDGGRSRSALPIMFQQFTRSEKVDVLICTHNDADHANGVLGFLESGLGCGEVWLPGRWLSALPDVLKPFVEVLGNLARTIDADDILLNTEIPDRTPLEAYADKLGDAPEESRELDSWPLVAEDGWPESYAQILDEAKPWDGPAEPFFNPFGLPQWQLLWSAIDAACRIRAIALAAFHRGIPVRWFEFDTDKPRGGVRSLQPVNARAIARARPRDYSLLHLLALTVSNRESLVFWSPPTSLHPGVLFTADSDLARTNLPPKLRGAVATAPHHGSEANAKAYAAVAAAAGQDYSSVTWIRSDGRYKSRPGKSYLGLFSRRLCTLCRHKGRVTPKQAVRLFSRRSMWIRRKGTVTCACV